MATRVSLNCWQGVIDDHRVYIHAAYDRDPATDACKYNGNEALYMLDIDPPPAYLMPRDFFLGCGHLWIEAVDGSIVTFINEPTGKILLVDLKQWLEEIPGN